MGSGTGRMPHVPRGVVKDASLFNTWWRPKWPFGDLIVSQSVGLFLIFTHPKMRGEWFLAIPSWRHMGLVTYNIYNYIIYIYIICIYILYNYNIYIDIFIWCDICRYVYIHVDCSWFCIISPYWLTYHEYHEYHGHQVSRLSVARILQGFSGFLQLHPKTLPWSLVVNRRSSGGSQVDSRCPHHGGQSQYDMFPGLPIYGIGSQIYASLFMLQ